jgi:hypothetical protein
MNITLEQILDPKNWIVDCVLSCTKRKKRVRLILEIDGRFQCAISTVTDTESKLKTIKNYLEMLTDECLVDLLAHLNR